MSTTYALMASSLITSVSSSISQASAAKNAGNFQADIYDSNARIAKMQADDAIKRGESEAAKNDLKTKQMIGKQRAAMAAQGLDLESGSALFIQQDTAAIGAEDSLTIKNNAWREAWGYESAALQASTQGQFTRLNTSANYKNTLITGGMTAIKDAAYIGYLSKTSSAGAGSNNKTGDALG